MMQVMFSGKHREKVISTMRNHRLQGSRSPEQKASKDMTAQKLWRQPKGEDGRHKIFQRVCVLGGESDWGFELMVLVVDALVEGFEV